MFRNFRHLSVKQLDTFNFDIGMFEIPPYDEEGEDPAMTTKRNVHVHSLYHYKIGQFQMSPYYVNYLSGDVIDIPGAHKDTVRN